ncbi:MAG: LPXTG cell wall anchor domain-containing protein, partial [Atopobium sp.]|nr:LPXTG cell wall anchor domain-containing protein [Atopobium sp.]
PTPAPEESSNPASPVKEKKTKKKKAQLPDTGEELLVMPLMVMGASALTAAGLMRRKH